MKELEENVGKILQDTEVVFFFILIKPQKVLKTKAKINN